MKSKLFPLKYLLTTIVFFTTALIFSCSSDDNGGPRLDTGDPLSNAPEINVTVTGTVLDENGKPLAGVEIDVHGETTLTNEVGTFLLEAIGIPGNRCVVKASKEGFFTSVRATAPKDQKQVYCRIVLMKSETTHTIDAITGGKAVLANGSEVQIPSNGLITTDGDRYTGTVNMTVRYLDPTNEGFGAVVPGGDMLAQRTDESTSILYSYGILRVLLKGTDGDDLQLASGKESTIIMAIPVSQQTTAPASIPLWYLDEEKGVWVEEGAAEKQGNQYVGKVKHFTDWNCDEPNNWATIEGRLVDCDNEGAAGYIGFGQVTSDIVAETESSPKNGKFTMKVPVGITVPVVIQNPLILPPWDKNTQGKVIVIVPPLSEGQVYDIGDLKAYPCTTKIIGSFKSNKGQTVKSMSFTTNTGAMSFSNVASSFSLNGFPANTDLNLTIKTSSGTTITKEVETAAEGQTINLGEITLDVDVTLSENSFVINGDGFNNQKQTFNSKYQPQGWYSNNNTQIRIGGAGETMEFSLQFEGKSTGAYKAAASSIRITDPVKGELNYYDKSTSPVDIEITRYDLVGGVIEGKFSGVFQKWKNGKPEGDVAISNGKFSVKRVDQ